MKRVLQIFLLLITIKTNQVRGEGTKELMPNNVNGTGLIVSTTATFPLGNVGNYLNCPADNRIYFNIKDFTKENFYYGFHWVFLTPSGVIKTYTDVYMRIYSPAGALVSTINLPNAGSGFISTYASAVAGPNIGGATPPGYNPLLFTPAQNGNYWIEFYRSSDGGATKIVGGETMLSPQFDMTVAQTNNTQFTGRVHCSKWAFTVYDPVTNLQSPSLSSQAQFFAYTTDSVTTRIDFQSGFRPLAFIIAVNSYGVQNTGNWLVDRKSINSTSLPALVGGYNVFLNPPDAILYPPAAIPQPPSLVSPVISGCPPGPYNVRFNAPQDGDYYVLLDLNGVPGFQLGTADRYFELINQLKGIINIVWDGKDGLGNPVPANTNFPITFSFRKGRINVPLYDVELNVNGFNVAAISPVLLPKSRLYWDDSQITTIGDGSCTSGTNNYNNTGIGYKNDIVGQVSPGHAWNGNGNAAFAIPSPAVAGNDVDNLQCNDFGNARLINTWAWGIELYITQSLTLGCINASGTVWDDADNSAGGTFTNIRTNSEPGTNASNSLYAILVDPVTNNVMNSVPVNANGTYLLPGCPINATGLKIVISTVPGVPGSSAPVNSIPSNWINTSPLTRIFNTGTTDVTGLDFGIERLPDSDPKGYTIAPPALNSYLTLNGPNLPSLPGPLTGSDPEDGAMGSGKKVVITQVPVIGELYYNGVRVTNNTTIVNYNPDLLQVKFTSLAVFSISFQYAFVDAGNMQDPSPAPYTINWSPLLKTNLLSFTAKNTNNAVVLNWIVADQSHTIQYIIEKSADGSRFDAIGSAQGSDSASIYTFIDNSPVSGATSYYRVKMADNTGKIAYSNIAVISFSDRFATSIFPNPVKDQVTVRINLKGTGNVVLRLMDNKGVIIQQIHKKGSKGPNVFQFYNLSGLPPAIYFIHVGLPEEIIVKKVYKQ
jgi:Secretion system C-terminal sorting domain